MFGRQHRICRHRLTSPILFVSAALLSTSGAATSLGFPDFSDSSSLNLNGYAEIVTNAFGDSVIRLVNASTTGPAQSGTVFLNDTFALGIGGEFSTSFDFQISTPSGMDDIDGDGADGIAFVLQSLSSDFRGAAGGYLGYGGTDPALVNSLAIEFDTFFNEYIQGPQFVTYPDIRDPDGNHVGVDVDGSVWSVATAAVPTRMNDGDVWRAWIDYSGVTQTLEVRVDTSTIRPYDPLLVMEIDVPSILGTNNVYAGFTAGTAGGAGDHDILAWTLSSEIGSVPVPTTAWLVALALGVYGYVSKRKSIS